MAGSLQLRPLVAISGRTKALLFVGYFVLLGGAWLLAGQLYWHCATEGVGQVLIIIVSIP